jgi:hypothetical protein
LFHVVVPSHMTFGGKWLSTQKIQQRGTCIEFAWSGKAAKQAAVSWGEHVIRNSRRALAGVVGKPITGAGSSATSAPSQSPLAPSARDLEWRTWE